MSDAKNKLIEIGNELTSKFKKQDELQAEYSVWFKENKLFLGQLDRYKYIDKGGVYTGSQSVHNPGREGYRYDVIHPVTKMPCKQPLMGYRFPEDTMKELLADKKILFGEDENKIIELKVYAHEYEDKLPSAIQLDGRLGSYDLKEIFPKAKKAFDNPKPVQLLKQIFSYIDTSNEIVLDSFAGSGTTAQAILELNKEDGGNRRFILVECENYADTTTAERVRTVIEGIKSSKRDILKNGTGGSFSYFELGDPIEMESLLRGKKLPSFKEFARYLFYTATGEEFSEKLVDEKSGFIGESRSYGVYLVYKPELDWLKTNALTLDRLKELPKHNDKKRLVFAPTKYVDDHTLSEFRVEFCQLPYEIYRLQK